MVGEKVKDNLLAWNGMAVGKREKRIWKVVAPICIFWTIWKQRNKCGLGRREAECTKVDAEFLN